MTEDVGGNKPTPDVMSDDKVLLKEAVARIVQLNGSRTPEQVLSGLMRRYWAGELPLFKLRPMPYHEVDPDGNFRRVEKYATSEHHDISALIERSFGLPIVPARGSRAEWSDDEGGPIVAECLRVDWPRERLLCLLRIFEFSFVDKGFRSDLAGFQAVAAMAPTRAYGPKLECLTDLRTYAANLAAWCQREGLTCPPEWESVECLEAADASPAFSPAVIVDDGSDRTSGRKHTLKAERDCLTYLRRLMSSGIDPEPRDAVEGRCKEKFGSG